MPGPIDFSPPPRDQLYAVLGLQLPDPQPHPKATNQSQNSNNVGEKPNKEHTPSQARIRNSSSSLNSVSVV